MDEEILEQFFSGLSTRLETVKSIESQYRRELDRDFAFRFNYFDYIVPNELALSRIIAGFLDPAQTHGQGNLFLNKLIELLSKDGEFQSTLQSIISNLEDSSVPVKTEHRIHRNGNNRKIDIYIEITNRNTRNTFCLAFENKPYGKDEDNQIKDYLSYLVNKFDYKFLLIYLPGDGKPPEKKFR